MMKFYKETWPYWSSHRKHVDCGYTSLPTWTGSRDMERSDDQHFVDTNCRLKDWVGYMNTWSGVQNMIKKEGSLAVGELFDKFYAECCEILKIDRKNMMDLEIVLRTRYWITLYKK